jgi:hypothetical protein
VQTAHASEERDAARYEQELTAVAAELTNTKREASMTNGCFVIVCVCVQLTSVHHLRAGDTGQLERQQNEIARYKQSLADENERLVVYCMIIVCRSCLFVHLLSPL